jgi:hypothetical protein
MGRAIMHGILPVTHRLDDVGKLRFVLIYGRRSGSIIGIAEHHSLRDLMTC